MKFFLSLVALFALSPTLYAEDTFQAEIVLQQQCDHQRRIELGNLFSTTVLENSAANSKVRLAYEYYLSTNSGMINILTIDPRTHPVVAEFNTGIEDVIIDMIEENSADKNFRQKYVKGQIETIGNYINCLNIAD